MKRVIGLLALLAAIAVPVVGWFGIGWSGGTTLAVYWFETLASCAFIAIRVLLHRRWSPRRGHFRYQGPSSGGRSGQSESFLGGFSQVSFAFCAAHAIFLGAILAILTANGKSQLAQLDWRSVGFGCLSVLLFLALDFGIDIISLRQWTFAQLEDSANRGLSRIIVVHLTLIIGFIGIAVTGAPDALFGVFVVLKTMAALSVALPQYEPRTPPAWLSNLLNRVPNVGKGMRFEEFWAKDRADEQRRRERNEQPWTR